MRGSRRDPEAAASPRALRERAYRLLAQRDHSRLELARKLGVPPDDPLLLELLGLGYLDDRRFAMTFARQRHERGLGRERIVYELSLRGIDRALANEAVGEDDLDRAVELARKRLAGKRTPEQVMRFLIGRGYKPGLARRALEAASAEGERRVGDFFA